MLFRRTCQTGNFGGDRKLMVVSDGSLSVCLVARLFTESSSIDICSTTSLSSTHGYLRSPNYPESDYPDRQRCRCRLRASSRIVVRLLDLSTATDGRHAAADDADSCPSSSADLVRVSTAEGSVSRRYCGRLQSDRLPETFDTRRADAVVEFQTRGRSRARGFWLAYTS